MDTKSICIMWSRRFGATGLYATPLIRNFGSRGFSRPVQQGGDDSPVTVCHFRLAFRELALKRKEEEERGDKDGDVLTAEPEFKHAVLTFTTAA